MHDREFAGNHHDLAPRARPTGFRTWRTRLLHLGSGHLALSGAGATPGCAGTDCLALWKKPARLLAMAMMVLEGALGCASRWSRLWIRCRVRQFWVPIPTVALCSTAVCSIAGGAASTRLDLLLHSQASVATKKRQQLCGTEALACHPVQSNGVQAAAHHFGKQVPDPLGGGRLCGAGTDRRAAATRMAFQHGPNAMGAPAAGPVRRLPTETRILQKQCEGALAAQAGNQAANVAVGKRRDDRGGPKNAAALFGCGGCHCSLRLAGHVRLPSCATNWQPAVTVPVARWSGVKPGAFFGACPLAGCGQGDRFQSPLAAGL